MQSFENHYYEMELPKSKYLVHQSYQIKLFSFSKANRIHLGQLNALGLFYSLYYNDAEY